MKDETITKKIDIGEITYEVTGKSTDIRRWVKWIRLRERANLLFKKVTGVTWRIVAR
jgi:hypothetical protein